MGTRIIKWCDCCGEDRKTRRIQISMPNGDMDLCSDCQMAFRCVIKGFQFSKDIEPNPKPSLMEIIHQISLRI